GDQKRHHSRSNIHYNLKSFFHSIQKVLIDVRLIKKSVNDYVKHDKGYNKIRKIEKSSHKRLLLLFLRTSITLINIIPARVDMAVETMDGSTIDAGSTEPY